MRYLLLLLLCSPAFGATVYNPFTNKLDYTGTSTSTGTSISTSTYILNTTTHQVDAQLYVSTATVQHTLNVGNLVTRGNISRFTQTGTSVNLQQGLVDIFKNNSGVGQNLFSVGSNQQVDQFVIKDSQPLNMGVFGATIGGLNVGLASFFDKVMSRNAVDQHVNFWSSGNMIIQTAEVGDGGKDIIISPNKIATTRITSLGGITTSSSMTVTHANGVAVRYNVSMGSATILSGGLAGRGICWKTDTTLGYCSTTLDASGNCTCN
jgi:hypothetical protein